MISRIRAIFLRYFYEFPGLDVFSELFFWPLIDLRLWGLTITWIQRHEQDPQLPRLVLTALVLFQIFFQSSCGFSVHLAREFWDRNLLNLFATPLRLLEWILGNISLCLVKITITMVFSSLLAFGLYGVNVFAPGLPFLLYAVSLIISGWVLGLIAASVIIRFGQKVGMLAWMIPAFFAPLCAVFYPVSSLPDWVQSISLSLPMTYIFEAMRQRLTDGSFSICDLTYNLFFNALYLTGAVLLFRAAFERSRARGLNRLE